MSYDLQVFGRHKVDVAALVTESRGLVPGPGGQVLGRRGAYSFTVDGPFGVEAQDVPYDVLAHVLEPRWMWTILVEGSSRSEIPHAVKFAIRLARAADGVALDQQTGEVLAKVSSRTTVVPPKDTRIRLFEMSWYGFADAVATSPVDDWLELCGRFLPEGLPRRYGEYEPPQYRFDRDGPEPLRALVPEGVFFDPVKPCVYGGFWTNKDIQRVELSMHEAVLHDPAWQAAVRRLFVGYSERRAAFLAIGEVVGRVLWNGRSTSYDGREEDTFSLSRAGERWVGPTPYPAGLLHQAGPVPRRRNKLVDPLPADLRARQYGRQKLGHAARKPGRLAG